MSIETRNKYRADLASQIGKAPKKYRIGVTPRAVIIALLLIPINSYWIFSMEIIKCQGHPTTISLFYTSVFNLLALIILNGLIRRYVPRWVFSQGELITIYVMLNIAATLVSHDALQILISMMPSSVYLSTPSNNWQTLFIDQLPNWLVVKDPTAVKAFFGGGNLHDPEIYRPWIIPSVAWATFTAVLVGMYLCMNVLLRKQWTEREKLSYPLVQLPLDMTAEGAPLFKEKLLWYGFAIAAAIDIINGLNVLYPQVPRIPIMGIIYTPPLERPWVNMGSQLVRFHPFGIGLGMLLPVDLLFSCWFFYFVFKAQLVATAAAGLDTVVGMPFINEQCFGAYMGICVFAVYVSRQHFKNLIKHFFGYKADIDDRDEAISYRTAMWLLLAGAVFLTAFSRFAGLSWYLIGPFFDCFFEGLTGFYASTRQRPQA